MSGSDSKIAVLQNSGFLVSFLTKKAYLNFKKIVINFYCNFVSEKVSETFLSVKSVYARS